MQVTGKGDISDYLPKGSINKKLLTANTKEIYEEKEYSVLRKKSVITLAPRAV